MLPMLYMALIDNEDDKDTYKMIYDTYRRVLLAYAYSILNNYYLAEDAVAEAFFRLAKCFQKVHNFQVSHIVAYTVIIVRNICFDIIRAEKKQRTYIVETAGSGMASVSEDKVDHLLLESAVAKLPDIYRDAIILRYFFGLSISELSEQLGLSVSGVKKRITTALRLLRKELDDDQNPKTIERDS